MKHNNIDSAPRRGGGRARTTLLGLGAAAGLILPLAVVGAASASTTLGGCTVTPSTPAANGDVNASNVPYVDYTVTVTCDPGRSVEIDQQRWEKDFAASEGGDDMYGETFHTVDFTKAKVRKTKTWTYTGTLPANMDASGDVYREVYQKVSFQVTGYGIPSAWTAFESSAYRSIHE